MLSNVDIDLHRSRPPFPWPGAAVDIDFALRKYWWGGAEHVEADFTSFVLNGSTFDYRGLTPATGLDVRLSLVGLGTFTPGAMASAIWHTGVPGVGSQFWVLDDGSNIERVNCVQNTTGSVGCSTVHANALQANLGATTSVSNAIGVRHGIAMSYALNDVKATVNHVAITPDTLADLPVVNTLRIGRAFTGTEPLGVVSKILLFTSTKTQDELNGLAALMRNYPDAETWDA